jgi:hypothetical protein
MHAGEIALNGHIQGGIPLHIAWPEPFLPDGQDDGAA